MAEIKCFEVWMVDLNPTKAREINKTRPCVVVSPNEMAALATVLVAPMMTKGFECPSRISCEFAGKTGLILLDQIHALDKSRLIKNMGVVDNQTQVELCSRLQEMFAC